MYDEVYAALCVMVLAVVAGLVFAVGRNRSRNRLTPLAGLSFLLVVAGIVIGGESMVSYGLLAAGLLLAFLDVLTRSRAA
jgi:heme A synthase